MTKLRLVSKALFNKPEKIFPVVSTNNITYNYESWESFIISNIYIYIYIYIYIIKKNACFSTNITFIKSLQISNHLFEFGIW